MCLGTQDRTGNSSHVTAGRAQGSCWCVWAHKIGQVTVHMLLLAERRALAGVSGHTRSVRYFAASPRTAFYVNTNNLKSILRATDSQ